jgi:hypothetical protein
MLTLCRRGNMLTTKPFIILPRSPLQVEARADGNRDAKHGKPLGTERTKCIGYESLAANRGHGCFLG